MAQRLHLVRPSDLLDCHFANLRVSSADLSLGIDFFRHAVVNDSLWDYSTIDASTIRLADDINPGGINAYDPDLRPFQQAGAKVIEYHGWQDQVIPSGASGIWYDKVVGFYEALGMVDQVEDFYRLFMVPGMRHCSGGDGGKLRCNDWKDEVFADFHSLGD